MQAGTEYLKASVPRSVQTSCSMLLVVCVQIPMKAWMEDIPGDDFHWLSRLENGFQVRVTNIDT